jgi:hypothetical protein
LLPGRGDRQRRVTRIIRIFKTDFHGSVLSVKICFFKSALSAAWDSQSSYLMTALMDGNKTRFRVAGKFLSLGRL